MPQVEYDNVVPINSDGAIADECMQMARALVTAKQDAQTKAIAGLFQEVLKKFAEEEEKQTRQALLKAFQSVMQPSRR